VAEAAFIEMVAKQEVGATNTSIPVRFDIKRMTKTSNHGMVYLLTDKPGTKIQNTIFKNTGGDETSAGNTRTRISTAYNQGTTLKVLFTLAPGATAMIDTPVDFADMTEIDSEGLLLYKKTVFSPLKIGTTYYLSYAAYGGTEDDAFTPPVVDFPISTTAKEGEVSTTETAGTITAGGDSMPDCGIAGTSGILGSGVGAGTITGCAAQLIYYVLFVPTSFLFALTGTFFDWAFHYSVSNEAYESPFVVEGWGLVRDFCNLFFIFVLLYIAFSTILNVHGFKTKEMIVNVVIIGLLINFSLFAAQVIVDTSNILARVFYNSDAIKITKGGANGGGVIEPGPSGELPLSAALVNKVNPQNLVIQASKVGNIPDKGGKGNSDTIGAGTFILITLLAIAVNVVGLIVFLSVGLIFIARVVGIWIYMILAPLAFFSYTVPQMQGIDMIGWKKWWPELISMAFIAPIFIFFLYLILKFLETGLGLIQSGDKDGIQFVIGIMVPFAFIMILLWKAKGIAKKMSGELGQQITGAVAAVGGLALGGAALGGAALLRGTLGRTAKYVQNNASRQKDSFKEYKNWSTGKKLNPMSYVKATAAGVAKQTFKIPGGGGKSLGHKMQDADNSFGKKQTGTHTLDEKATHEFANKNGYAKDVKYNDLKEPDQQKVKDSVDKDIMSKEVYGKKFDSLTDTAEIDSIKNAMPSRATDPTTGKLSFTVQAIKKDPTDPNKLIPTTVDRTGANAVEGGGEYHEKNAKSGQAVGEFVQALRKGSMDIRNLSQTKAASKGVPKLAVGLLAAVAAGTRMGMKQSGVNHGTGQGDFIKDLGSTITDALKGMKVDVKVDKAGHGEGKAGGGDHH